VESATKHRMLAKVILQKLASILARLLWSSRKEANPFAPTEKELEQTRLIGMYISQANNKPTYAAPTQRTGPAI
jgi:hypothetical protein